MQSSSKRLPAAHAAALIAALALAGCGLTRKDAPAPVPSSKPAQTIPGKPAGTTPTKPDEKPAPAQRPAEKGDPQQRFDEALALLKGNQIGEAEQAFTWLTQDFPQYAGPWTNLGIIFARSNRSSQAFTHLVRAVELNDNDATAWNWLGILYRQSRDYKRAESAYKSALKADDDLALAHLNLGILYDEYLKRPADALPHYRRYVQLAGKDDLRVQAWIAAIQNPNPAAGPTKGTEELP